MSAAIGMTAHERPVLYVITLAEHALSGPADTPSDCERRYLDGALTTSCSDCVLLLKCSQLSAVAVENETMSKQVRASSGFSTRASCVCLLNSSTPCKPIVAVTSREL